MKTTFKKGDTVLIKKGLATYLDDENPLTVLEARSGYCRLEDVDGYVSTVSNRHITMLKAKRGRPFGTSLKNEYRGNSPSVTKNVTEKKTKSYVCSKAKELKNYDYASQDYVDETANEILENAEQVKSWNKYGECNCYNYFTYGLLVACVAIFTVMAMWSASTLQIN